jgi:hypothetical protein
MLVPLQIVSVHVGLFTVSIVTHVLTDCPEGLAECSGNRGAESDDKARADGIVDDADSSDADLPEALTKKSADRHIDVADISDSESEESDDTARASGNVVDADSSDSELPEALPKRPADEHVDDADMSDSEFEGSDGEWEEQGSSDESDVGASDAEAVHVGKPETDSAPTSKASAAAHSPQTALQQLPLYYDVVDDSVGIFLYDLEQDVFRLRGVGPPRTWRREQDSDSEEDANSEADTDSDDSRIHDRAVLFLKNMCKLIVTKAVAHDLDGTVCLIGCLRSSLRRVIDVAYDYTHDWEDPEALRKAEEIAEAVLRTEYDLGDNYMLPLLPDKPIRDQCLVSNPRVTIERCDDDYRRMKAGGADISGLFAASKLEAAACSADAPSPAACDLDFLAAKVNAVRLCQELSNNVQSPFHPALGGERGPKRASSHFLNEDDVYLGKVEVFTGFAAHIYVSAAHICGNRLAHWLTRDLGKNPDDVAAARQEWQRHPISFLTKCITSGQLGDVLHVNAPACDPTDDGPFAFPTLGEGQAHGECYKFQTRSSGLALNVADDGVVRSASGHRGTRQKYCFEDLVYLLRLLGDSRAPILSLYHFGEKLSLERTAAIRSVMLKCRVPDSPLYIGVGCNQLESEAVTADRKMQDLLMLSLSQTPAGSRIRGCKVENFPTGAGSSMASEDDEGLPEMRYGNCVARLAKTTVSRGRNPLLQAYLQVFAKRGDGASIFGQPLARAYDVTFYSSVSDDISQSPILTLSNGYTAIHGWHCVLTFAPCLSLLSPP